MNNWAINTEHRTTTASFRAARELDNLSSTCRIIKKSVYPRIHRIDREWNITDKKHRHPRYGRNVHERISGTQNQPLSLYGEADGSFNGKNALDIQIKRI